MVLVPSSRTHALPCGAGRAVKVREVDAVVVRGGVLLRLLLGAVQRGRVVVVQGGQVVVGRWQSARRRGLLAELVTRPFIRS